jgi:hypothetical protein
LVEAKPDHTHPFIHQSGNHRSTAAMAPFRKISLHSLRFVQSWMYLSERSSAWLERVVWVHEVAGSNPVAPTIFSAGRFWFIHRIIHHVWHSSPLAKISFRGQKKTELRNRCIRVEF